MFEVLRFKTNTSMFISYLQTIHIKKNTRLKAPLLVGVNIAKTV